jgi:hypothetical protein
MKKGILITTCLALSVMAEAQITLNASNAPSKAQCQVQDTFVTVVPASVPSLAPKTNATWDLKPAVDIQGWGNFNKPANSTVFPKASFQILTDYLFAGALKYSVDRYYDVDNSGILVYGEHLDRQALPIGSYTGSNTDSLVFELQDVLFAPTNVQLQYPSTMGTTWTTVVKINTKFSLTIAGYAMINAPGERRNTLTTKNTVVGWGKMRINGRHGVPTEPIDVLQIKVESSSADSIYLNGTPAPDALLAAFGITQGQVVSSYHYNFHRAGEYRPLVSAEYSDNTFSTIVACEIQRQRLPMATSVNTISKEQISVYPNPVINHTVTIQLDGTHNSNANYTLFNTIGQQVATGTIPANGLVNLPAGIIEGLYILKVNAGGATGVQQLRILN